VFDRVPEIVPFDILNGASSFTCIALYICGFYRVSYFVAKVAQRFSALNLFLVGEQQFKLIVLLQHYPLGSI
jgi:hypothetical protein